MVSKVVWLKVKLPSGCNWVMTSTPDSIEVLSKAAFSSTIWFSSVTVPLIVASKVILSVLVWLFGAVSLNNPAAITGNTSSIFTVTLYWIVLTFPAVSVLVILRIWEPFSKPVKSKSCSKLPSLSTVNVNSSPSLKLSCYAA